MVLTLPRTGHARATWVEGANNVWNINITMISLWYYMVFRFEYFLILDDTEFSVQKAHFQGESIGASCVLITCKTAKLFTFFLSSSQHGHTIVMTANGNVHDEHLKGILDFMVMTWTFHCHQCSCKSSVPFLLEEGASYLQTVWLKSNQWLLYNDLSTERCAHWFTLYWWCHLQMLQVSEVFLQWRGWRRTSEAQCFKVTSTTLCCWASTNTKWTTWTPNPWVMSLYVAVSTDFINLVVSTEFVADVNQLTLIKLHMMYRGFCDCSCCTLQGNIYL